jgi:hypothetical protein
LQQRNTRRKEVASSAFASLATVWKSQNINVATKMRILDACVLSTLLYACEWWTLKTEDVRRLNAFEMRCYRKIMRICWKDMVSNKKIREDIRRQITVVDKIKARKLQLFGHICRMGDNRLIKTVMLGRVDGVRKKRTTKRRWLDDIKDWSGLDIQQAVHMAQERTGIWARKVVPTVGLDGPLD